MTKRLIFLALFLAVMIPLGMLFHWLVYDVMPEKIVGYLAVAIFCLSLGFLLGQRHGIER